MKIDAELKKHTLNLYDGDYLKLQELYPDLGAATIIRRIVRAFINQIEEKGSAVEIDVNI